MTRARVLCIAPSWLGDVLLARPALQRLGRCGFEIDVMVRGGLGRLVADLPGVARIVTSSAESRTRRFRAAADLRARRYDAALVLPPSFAAAFAAWLAGARQRVGLHAGARPFLLTRCVPDPGRDVHLAVQYVRITATLCAELGVVQDVAATNRPGSELPPMPLLEVRPEEADAARALLGACGVAGPFVVVAPGARYGPAKRYPADRFAAAANVAARRLSAAIVLVGATEDRAATAAVRTFLPSAHDLAGRTDLPALVGLLGASTGVIANDSGTMHLAAVLGRPVVGIFGSTHPAWTRPLGPHAAVVCAPVWCAPCFAPTCRQDFACMLGIAPDAVASALLDAVASSGTGRPARETS